MRKDIKTAINKELEFVRAKIYKSEENIGTILDYISEAGKTVNRLSKRQKSTQR